MADVVIVGDGPAGLSAALFLSKNGLDVVLLGCDETPAHLALVNNYLGIPQITGTELLRVGRQQVARFGGKLRHQTVTALEQTDAGWAAVTDTNEKVEGRYLILATGTKRDLAAGIGLATAEDGSVVNERTGRTALPGLYCIGWTARGHQIELVISAGDGAAAALDILTIEKGKPFHDFDVVPKGE
ncbi:MAG: FAD-dependent oxidoreductase [Armatimonadetes bacterium]|nr:FAD-dependent oxidoreductase [Armatimonadota bacterium]